jgi:hypothetical protein
MGSYFSRMRKKKNKIDFKDFNKVIIPKGYDMIKIGSYNINIRNNISLQEKINEITKFVHGEFKNKDFDIICLQGIRDYNSAYLLVQEVKSKMKKYNELFYFAPEFNEVASRSESFPFISGSKDKFDGKKGISWNTKVNSIDAKKQPFRSEGNQRNMGFEKRTIVQNIILSKYPIVSTIYAELDGDHTIDDIIGVHTILGANISISGNIISIYNTELSKDIRTANIINTDVRSKEIRAIFSVMQKNMEELATKFQTYNKTDVHLLLGSLNINESDGTDMTEEFTSFISNNHCVDVLRYLTDDYGYTTSTRERLNYVLMKLTDDIYEPDSVYNDNLQELKTPKDLFNFIFKRYGIYFLDIYVRTDMPIGGGQINYPIECVFMINKYKH